MITRSEISPSHLLTTDILDSQQIFILPQTVAEKPGAEAKVRVDGGAAGRAAAVRRSLGMKMFTLGTLGRPQHAGS